MRSAADRDGNPSSFAVPEQGRQKRVPLERDRPFRAGAARRGTIELNKPSINHAENVAEAPRLDGLEAYPRSRRSFKRFRQNRLAAFQARHPADAYFPDFIISKKLNDRPGGRRCGDA